MRLVQARFWIKNNLIIKKSYNDPYSILLSGPSCCPIYISFRATRSSQCLDSGAPPPSSLARSLSWRLQTTRLLYCAVMILSIFIALSAASSARVPHYEGAYTNEWAKSPLAINGSSEVRFTMVLREQGIEMVKRIALDVNDPTSSAYGALLTQSEVGG